MFALLFFGLLAKLPDDEGFLNLLRHLLAVEMMTWSLVCVTAVILIKVQLHLVTLHEAHHIVAVFLYLGQSDVYSPATNIQL